MGNKYYLWTDDVDFFHAFDKHPDQSEFEMHVHAGYELFLFVSGKASYLVEGNEYSLTPGSLILIREAESHAVNFSSDAPYERYVLNFSPSVVANLEGGRELLVPFKDRPLGCANIYEPSELKNISALSYFRAMCVEEADNETKKLAIVTHLQSLLFDVARAFRKKGAPELSAGSEAGDIIAYINEHLFEPLSVGDIASRFYLSSSQIERIVKTNTHSSLWQYITRKRLAAARARIESGEGATLVSEECGFRDYSAFFRAYVKEYGCSPNLHKQKIRK